MPSTDDDPRVFRVGGISYLRIPAEDPRLAAAVHGGEIVTAPYPEGDLWVATFRDPAGNVLGVWQRGPRD